MEGNKINLKEWLEKNVKVLNDDAFVCFKQNSKIDCNKQFIKDVMKEINSKGDNGNDR